MADILKQHLASDSERVSRTSCDTLSPTSKELVEFDPHNQEHIRAYVMLAHQGKQHPELRFFCPEQSPSVLDLMRIRMADTLSKEEIKETTGSYPKFIEDSQPNISEGLSKGDLHEF